MRAQSVTLSSATTSNAIPMDYAIAPFSVSLAGVVTGTATWKVQYTYDDVFNPNVTPNWFDHATLTGKTANADGTITNPVKAVRLNVTAYTNGTITLTILQGRGN